MSSKNYKKTKNKKKEEVEIKAKLSPAKIKNTVKKLKEMGAEFKEEIKEEDLYFTSKIRDFIKTKECLRIRKKNDCLELTYKGPTTGQMKKKKQFWKPEINLDLSSKEEEARKMLNCLGFSEVAEVDKNRKKFILDKQEISFDNVKGVGWFVEIENTAQNAAERKKALKENIGLLKKLGLKEKNVVNEPYRDLVIKKRK